MTGFSMAGTVSIGRFLLLRCSDATQRNLASRQHSVRTCCLRSRSLQNIVTSRFYLSTEAAADEVSYDKEQLSKSSAERRDEVSMRDIVVCGGGIMGLATAIALCSSPALSECRVTLLERGPPTPPRVPGSPEEFSARTCALNVGSRALLERLDVWRRLPRYGCVRRMQVWDACSDAMIRFDAETDASTTSSASALTSALGFSRADGNTDAVSAANDADGGALAWIVENRALLGALSERLSELASVCETVYDCGQVSVDTASSQVSACVSSEGGRSRRCWGYELLVGADGASSVVRQAMKVPVVGWPYNQRAVVATLFVDDNGATPDIHARDEESVLPSDGDFELGDNASAANSAELNTSGHSASVGNCVAWQRFLPSGPLALLPLSANRSALVWSTSNEHAQELSTVDDASFIDAVNSALWRDHSIGSRRADEWWRWGSERLGELLNTTGNRSPSGARQLPPSISGVAPGSRASFPLGLQHAVRYISASGPGCKGAAVLVGDAAHRVHPLAGHGANLGLADVSELADQLSSSVADYGRGLKAHQPLVEYERRRMPAAVAMLALTNSLHFLYTSQSQPVVLARSFGLQVCDALSPVRQFLARNARS